MDERGVDQRGEHFALARAGGSARGGIVGGLILVMIGIGLLVAQFTSWMRA